MLHTRGHLHLRHSDSRTHGGAHGLSLFQHMGKGRERTQNIHGRLGQSDVRFHTRISPYQVRHAQSQRHALPQQQPVDNLHAAHRAVFRRCESYHNTSEKPLSHIQSRQESHTSQVDACRNDTAPGSCDHTASGRSVRSNQHCHAPGTAERLGCTDRHHRIHCLPACDRRICKKKRTRYAA